MDNFFKRPVGAAVLYLNDFHHGKRLNDLNRCARLVPDDVKGIASLLSQHATNTDITFSGAIIDDCSLAEPIEGVCGWVDDASQTQR